MVTIAPSTDDERVFADAFMDTARRALEANGALSRTVSIADRPVRMHFAGDQLERAFWPALRHRQTDPAGAPPLELTAWDSASTGIEPPTAPWDGVGFAAWSRPRAHRRNEIEFHLCGMGTFSMLDRRHGRGSYWVRSLAVMPPWDPPAPFRSLFALWAPEIDGGLLHAAAVGNEKGGVLLTARGGSGKSTTAVAALLRGMLFVGEDYVLVQRGSPPCVHNLYATAKLDARSMTSLFGPSAAGSQRPPRTGRGADGPEGPPKEVVYLDETHGRHLAASLPIVAIIVPAISARGRATLVPLGAAAVLRALAPTTLLQMPGSDAHGLATLAGIVSAVPGYALEVGPDHAENVDLIRGVLTELRP